MTKKVEVTAAEDVQVQAHSMKTVDAYVDDSKHVLSFVPSSKLAYDGLVCVLTYNGNHYTVFVNNTSGVAQIVRTGDVLGYVVVEDEVNSEDEV